MPAAPPPGSADAAAPPTEASAPARPDGDAVPDRPWVLRRPRLVDRIVGAAEPVVAVVAPAGYGKSTLLGHVADHLPGSTTLRIDETDDDPIVLMGHLLGAIEAVRPLDPDLRRTLTTPAEFAGFRGPARLTRALAQDDAPLTLLLDDVHLVADRTALDWLAWIMDRLPPGVRIILASRRELSLPVGRLIAEARLLLLGAHDLAFDAGETQELGALAGVPVTPPAAAALVARTEGWALALQLLLRAGQELGGGAKDVPDGPVGEAGIVRYLRSELLDRMDPSTRTWVLRSAVLDELSGPLCDAALETEGSLRMLRQLEAQNQLLLPVDPGRTVYRYHALYREFLLGELETLPGERARVAARAAEHLVQAGDVVRAAHYAELTGDLDLFARYVERYAFPIYWSGRLATVSEWIRRFDRDGIRERYASVATLGAWSEALRGDTANALRWLATAERSVDQRTPPDGSPDFSGWVAVTRANLMPRGASRCAEDVATARERLAAGSPMRFGLSVQQVGMELMGGRLDAADDLAKQCEETHRSYGALPGLTTLLGLRGAIAIARGDLAEGRRHVLAGRTVIDQAGLEDYSTSVLVFAVGARLAAADGDTGTATADLTRVNRLRPISTVATPLVALMARLQAIRAAISLRESAMARTLLAEVEEILLVRPEMGVLVDEARLLRPILDHLRTASPSPWTLTAAELRLLAYLPTHLTFREIAERMFLSPHTIKTQAMSIYGKLEVSSRREAIERAVEVNLLDASVLHQADGTVLIA